MTRNQAINACRELGFGWELPTKIQLDLLYKNKILIGGFINDAYWSSTLNEDGMGWSQNFSNGYNLLSEDPDLVSHVRAVRVLQLNQLEEKSIVNKTNQDTKDSNEDLDVQESVNPTEEESITNRTTEEVDKDLEEFLRGPQVGGLDSGEVITAFKFNSGKPFATTINTASDKRYYTDSELKEANKPENIIGKPIKIGNLLVAQNEFTMKSDWNNAKASCLKLGPGWRLPTKDELYILYQNKNLLRNFSKYGYWSSTEGSEDGVAYFQDFTLGSTKPSLSNKQSTWGIRAVKAF